MLEKYRAIAESNTKNKELTKMIDNVTFKYDEYKKLLSIFKELEMKEDSINKKIVTKDIDAVEEVWNMTIDGTVTIYKSNEINSIYDIDEKFQLNNSSNNSYGYTKFRSTSTITGFQIYLFIKSYGLDVENFMRQLVFKSNCRITSESSDEFIEGAEKITYGNTTEEKYIKVKIDNDDMLRELVEAVEHKKTHQGSNVLMSVFIDKYSG